MPHYHLYQTDYEGLFLHGASFILPDDRAAFDKARNLVDGCNVEIWRDEMKIAVLQRTEQSPVALSLEAAHVS